jgi:uncharacterized integral membrane protein
MRYVTGSLAVLLLFLVVAFSIQNREPVAVWLLFWSMSIPKVFLILGTFLLGMAFSWGLLVLIKR